MDLIKKIIGGLLEIFYRATQNYGFSIVLLTILVKALMTPLVISQKKQMKQNSELAPKIKYIKEKYKNDKEKMTEEITKLYKEKNESVKWLHNSLCPTNNHNFTLRCH